jgi:hypothetical protein
MDCPVVVAVIVDGPFAVVQEAILAGLEGQSPVLTFEELVTEFGVVVSSQAIHVWAWWQSKFLTLRGSDQDA